MCSRPITQFSKATGGEVTFACRSCDECIATRRHGWVARAMAEKTCHPHCLVVALTYDESSPENRDASRVFCYDDVRGFLKRLLAACRYEAKKAHLPMPVVRFLCAGEQGERNGRCHWHLILYSTFDLTQIGTFDLRGQVLTSRGDMLTVGKRKRRLNWSIWGKGFVTLQEPDQGGMNYVLSYCLKDQFTEEKSRGTMREAKSENFSTGLFRMSKRPAIGEAFLIRKLEGLDALHSVLPSLQITIPGFSGFWHPNGLFREKMLWHLVALNRRAVFATGANAPQWSSLVSSVSDNPSEKEILCGQETETQDNSEEIGPAFENRGRYVVSDDRAASRRRRCGGELPCSECLNRLSNAALNRLGVARDYGGAVDAYHATQGFDSVENRQARAGGSLNPYCQQAAARDNLRAFPQSAPKVAACPRDPADYRGWGDY